MKLRTKVVATVGGILAIAGASILYFANEILLERFDSLEIREGEANMARLQEGINSRLDMLSSKVRDWGWWNDSADFVSGINPDFAETDMTAEYFPTLGLTFMVFTNLNGELIGGKRFEFAKAAFIEDSESMN